jgi:hypothetical protein
MPLTAQNLADRYLNELAGGNTVLFWRLLTEADESLLAKGRWSWVRERLTLSVVDGRVVLPDGYESIMGCRAGGTGSSVQMEEIEYLEDSPGNLPVQNSEARLIDQGLIFQEDGSIELEVPSFNSGEKLLPAGEDQWSSTGSSQPHPSGFFFLISRPTGGWRLELFIDGLPHSIWQLGGDSPYGEWDGPDEAVTRPGRKLQRNYKVLGEVTELVVLARFEARPIVEPNDIPRCQSSRALRRAMMAIIWEEAGELKKAIESEALAIQTLNEEEQAHRGSARQIYKPSLFGPARRRSRSAFP